MYTITSKPDGTYTVTVELPNTKALAEWLKSQGTATSHTVPMLTSREAISLAKAQGHPLTVTALNTYCNRGNISGAVKDGTRWQIPRDSLLSWLNRKAEKAHGEDAVLWNGPTH
jgi:hypothetical protein